MNEREEILRLAKALEDSEVIEVHSGDREPGSQVSRLGRKWIIDGLRLLASRQESK
jgi:hypothetical protein